MSDTQLEPEEIRVESATMTESGAYIYPDAQALQLVIDDLDRCDAYQNINIWASQWILADTLLQSPQNTNMLLGTTRSNIPVFTLSNHLSAIVPKAMGAMFYENPPFLLRPRPKVTQDVIRAKTALFSYQLDDMFFEEQCEMLMEQDALLGTCIAKWGFETRTEKVKVYKQKEPAQTIKTDSGYEAEIHTEDSDEIVSEYEERKIARPWLKFVDIRTVRVDPGCRVGDIREAKYVLHSEYPTYRDLDDLRDQPGYSIPSEEVLKGFFASQENVKQSGDNLAMTMPEGMRGWLQHAVPRNQRTTADPLQSPLELIERQDCNSVITVLRHGTDYVLIRNEENPARAVDANHTYLSANWRNLPDCFYGQGLGMLIGVEQIVEQGLKNLSVDLVSYGLHPQAVRKKGFNAPTQSVVWRQGGIIDVDDDVDKAFKFLEMPPVPAEVWQFIQTTKAQAQETSGANEQTVMGSASAGTRSTGMRSGTGAALVGQASASRLDGPVNRFIRQIFVPFLEIMDGLNNEFLPTSVLRDVLDEQGLSDLKVDHVAFRNAKMDYEVLAGAHLGPRKEMAQFMPFLLQIANNPSLIQAAGQEGLQFSFSAFFKTMADLAGFKYSQDFFRKMTPEENQKHQAQTPAALQAGKLQAAQQAQAAQFQHEEQLEEQKTLGRASTQVLRTVLEHASTSELQGGSYGSEGSDLQ
jgi:hypothetical protein